MEYMKLTETEKACHPSIHCTGRRSGAPGPKHWRAGIEPG